MNDRQRRNFLEELDEADFDVTDWEANFIESCLKKQSYSKKQQKVIDDLKMKYGGRL